MPSTMTRPDWTKQKFLIVDGDEAFGVWAESALAGRRAGEVRRAVSGGAAYQMLREYAADIALVDIRLPAMSGVDFIRWIRDRSQSPNADLPIVLMIATADPAMLRDACAAGIEGFLRKPTTEGKLLARLRATISDPRRFVIGRQYFGPDRRLRQAPFDGPDRRKAHSPESATVAPQPSPPPAAKPAPAPVAVTVTDEKPIPAAAARRPAAPAAAAKPMPQRHRKVVAPAALGPRPKAREWQEDPGEAAPPAARPKAREWDDDVPQSERKTRPDGDWKDALGAEKVASKRPPATMDLGPILGEHGTWLASGGKEGKRADLTGKDLHGADLAGANLANANLQDADLSDATCREAVFQGADLRRADLSSADANGANLGVARLRHAKLGRAILDSANLRGSDLAGADLRGASMDDTDMSGANMLGTDLREADLSAARGLTQAQIGKVRTDADTRLPGGLRAPRGND